ncbi:MAG: hypothetical protein V1907_05045 [Candidatus Kerfeldbacteria bacterium]
MKSRVLILPIPLRLTAADLERYRNVATILATEGTVHVTVSIMQNAASEVIDGVLKVLRDSYGVTARNVPEYMTTNEAAGVANVTLVCEAVDYSRFLDIDPVIHFTGFPGHAHDRNGAKESPRLLEMMERGPFTAIYTVPDDGNVRCNPAGYWTVAIAGQLSASSSCGYGLGVVRLELPFKRGQSSARIHVRIVPKPEAVVLPSASRLNLPDCPKCGPGYRMTWTQTLEGSHWKCPNCCHTLKPNGSASTSEAPVRENLSPAGVRLTLMDPSVPTKIADKDEVELLLAKVAAGLEVEAVFSAPMQVVDEVCGSHSRTLAEGYIREWLEERGAKNAIVNVQCTQRRGDNTFYVEFQRRTEGA